MKLINTFLQERNHTVVLTVTDNLFKLLTSEGMFACTQESDLIK